MTASGFLDSRVTKLFEYQSRNQAVYLQTRMSRLVVEKSSFRFKPRLFCGLDAAYEGEQAFASAVIWDADGPKATHRVVFKGQAKVEYLPGLLGFREGPLLVSAARNLDARVDVFLVDGHGLAHPRRFGLACHVGLALNRPTIGVAKSHLYGRLEGGRILDSAGKLLGRVVRARNGSAFYVSVGHRVGLEDAVRLVKSCMVDNHPVPLREAHLEAGRARRDSFETRPSSRPSQAGRDGRSQQGSPV